MHQYQSIGAEQQSNQFRKILSTINKAFLKSRQTAVNSKVAVFFVRNKGFLKFYLCISVLLLFDRVATDSKAEIDSKSSPKVTCGEMQIHIKNGIVL